MKLNREEIETQAWEMVRAGQAPSERTLQDWISKEVHKRINSNQSSGGFRSYTRTHTGPGHQQVVRDVLWSLLLARVIRPGASSQGNSLSWDETKLWGSQQHEALPADPAFLARLAAAGLSGPILVYVQHSIRALAASPTAAMSMLGNASELLINRLVVTFSQSSFATADLESRLDKNWQISQRFKLFKAEFDPQARKILRDASVSDGSDTFITAVFDHIRLDRNEAGHPSGREFAHDEVQANLMLFGVHIRRCLPLINYLEGRKR